MNVQKVRGAIYFVCAICLAIMFLVEGNIRYLTFAGLLIVIGIFEYKRKRKNTIDFEELKRKALKEKNAAQEQEPVKETSDVEEI